MPETVPTADQVSPPLSEYPVATRLCGAGNRDAFHSTGVRVGYRRP